MEACVESRHQRCNGDEDKEDVSAYQGVQVVLLDSDEPVSEDIESNDNPSHD